MRIKTIFFLSIMIHCCNIYSSQPAEINLATLMQRYGTDKDDAHNYASAYEYHFLPLRDKSLKFLEIGFLTGASARIWEKYFPNATLHFIDIEPTLFTKYGKDLSSRCKLHIADQGNRNELTQFIKEVGSDFDVIIDDGGHEMHQQITSFETLFPHVKSGGLYVIEDLHTSYWSKFGGSGSVGSPQTNEKSTIRFLQSLIDHVNFISALTGYANVAKCPKPIYQKLSFYQRSIKSIHFYRSICFIVKN